MGKDEVPLITRRTTRSSSAAAISTKNNVVESTTSTNIYSPSTLHHPLIFYMEENPLIWMSCCLTFQVDVLKYVSFVDFGSSECSHASCLCLWWSFNCKNRYIAAVIQTSESTLCLFELPHMLQSRILFESVLNQLSCHGKNATNGYSSVKRCEKPSDFVNFLCEALVVIVKSIKENRGKSKSSKIERSIDENMVYLIFDKLELARDWDKSSTILPSLFNLDSILQIPEVGLIFISSAPPDTFYSSMGYIEPIPIYFPTYNEGDLCQILGRNQANPKLYSSFLDVILRPFCRITRRLDELLAVFAPLFVEYCKPLIDLAIVPNEDLKRKLFSNLQPHISFSERDI